MLTDRVRVNVVKVLELPRRPSGHLVSPPLPLLILHHQSFISYHPTSTQE